MAAKRCRYKKSKTMENSGGVDLISKLPDEVLAHILSFVGPTRVAVATSVLSRRWKLLWTLVPNLQLGFDDAPPGKQTRALFEDFVDRVLSLNNVVSVRKVHLLCSWTDPLRANAWLQALVTRKAEVFILNLLQSYFLEHTNWPQTFFNQKKLVKLDLGNVALKVPKSVSFPCLKTIKLFPVGDVESVKNLLSGSPALTDLSLHLKKFTYKQTLCISSSSLETLKISSWGDKENCAAKIVIDAPKLVNLNIFHERSNTAYDMINVSSLSKASIDYATDENTLFDLLGNISHVEELMLCWDSLHWRVLQKYFERRTLKSPLVFYNLTRLKLITKGKGSLFVLPSVLDSTPNGVHIILKLTGCSRPHLWKEPLDLPLSISSCIKSVEIIKENCESMISCILENATTLKRLSFLSFPDGVVRENEVIKTLLAAGAMQAS